MTRESDQDIQHSSLVQSQDRRRPGRSAVNPVLIPLLRKPEAHTSLPDGVEPGTLEPWPFTLSSDEDDDTSRDTDAIQGIMISLLLSVPLWLLVTVALIIVF